MTKATPVRLKLLMSVIFVTLYMHLSFGKSESTVESPSTTFTIQHVKSNDLAKPALSVGFDAMLKLAADKSALSENLTEVLPMMGDSACTSNEMDTFFVNTVPNTDMYTWSVPTGATITSTIGDTMIIVDWTNSVLGNQEICIETVNNCGTSAPVCFPISVVICNLSPVAVPDRDTTPANSSILVNVQTNDSDPDNGTLTTSLYAAGNPANGSISLLGNNIIYSPNTNFTGTDNFNYIICDDGNPILCDTTQVTIVVENTAPNAVDDQANATVGATVTIPVQNNDSDPENHTLTTSLDTNNGLSQGTISLNGNEVQYTPNANATISDQFDYIICDNGTPSLCDTATVNISIANRRPIAVNDQDTTLSNQAITINVQNNDSDPENGNLSTTLYPANSPNNGTLTVTGDNIQYTPNANFTGTDDFDYIICDDGSPSLCDTATVNVVVLNRKPTAVNDVTSTPSGVPVSIAVQNNDTDPENGNLTTALEPNNGPSNGTVMLNGDEIIYTPGLGFSGTDMFDYIICDDGFSNLCDTATVTISTENQAPIAVPDSETTPFETPITIDVQDNDSDPEGGSLTTILNPSFPPANGTVSVINGDSILYTPNNGFLGTDQFGYIICDSGIPTLCDTTIVTIGVPNDPPTAVNDFNNTLENTPVAGQILTNDFDINDNALILNQLLANNASNGTVNLNPDGSYTYTPNNGFTGEDVFEYQICDVHPNSFCDTGRVVIEVIESAFSGNRPPVANPDNYVSEVNTVFNGNISSNDVEPDGDNILLNTLPLVAPNNGSVTVFPDGNFQYTPNTDFTGEDTFIYNICDNGTPFLCDTTRVTINTIPNTGNSIFAVDDAVIGDANTTLTGDVSTNDTDPEGHPFTVNTTPVNPVDNGTLTLNTNGTFAYTPNAGYSGPDLFQYQICDNQLPQACDTATAYLTVLPSNQPPVAVDNNNLTQAGVATTGNVLDNDFDLEMDNIILNTNPLDAPDNGNVVLNADGSYTYTPNPTFVGTDFFTYEICDDGSPSLCDTAQTIIQVIGNNPLANDKPIAINDNFVTAINTPLDENILGNDIDPDGDNLNINTTPVSSPNNGTVNIRPNGTYLYTPNNDYVGEDSFEYSICNNGNPSLCDTATVNITIISSNPTDNFTFANEDTYSTDEDVAVSGDLLANDTDPEGDTQTIVTTPTSNPSNGSVTINPNGTFTYTPNNNYTGNDQFNYQVCDNNVTVACDTTTVYLTIFPVNDAPMAIDDTNVTNEDTPVNGAILPNDSDPENDNLTVNATPIEDVDNGTLVLNTNGTYTYTPDANYNGQDAFQYQICDDGIPSLCDTAEVIITINPVNDAPIAVDDTNSTNEDTPVNGAVLPNDTDLENGDLTVNSTPVDAPDNGTLTLNPNGTYTYTPNPGFNGTDSFQYEVCDDGTPVLCDTATVTISIGAVNDAPIAIDDTNVTEEDTPVNGAVLPNDSDPENDNLSVNTTPIEDVENGTLVLNTNGTYTYTPDANYNGQDTFQYQICDDGIPSLCDTAEVIITINPVNDKPIAVDDTNTTNEDTPVNGSVLPNDTDLENDNLTVNTTPIDAPDNGTLVLNPNGTYTFTPNPNFNGTDSFQYEVCDGGTPSLCDTAEVVITINPVNDKPVAVDDVNSTDEDTPVNGLVLPNDSDLESLDLMVTTTPVDAPDNGTLTLNMDGSYSYTPNPNFNGTDSFQYEVCDKGTPILCDTATVVLTINPTNDAPVAVDDTNSTEEDMPVNGSVLPNDTDLENDDLTVNTTPVDAPDNGTLVINPDGTYTYTPNPNFNGTDSFQYEVCDDGTPALCDTATVVLTINPANDAPVAVDDTNSTEEDMPVNGSVLPNDTDLENDDLTVNTTPIDAPDNGTLVINPDRTYTYTPNPDFNGTDSFQYEVCDDGTPALCDTATVVLTINPVNDAPVAVDDTNTTDEEMPVNGTVLPNDSDLENDNLSVNTIPVENPANGTITLNPNGTYTYTPNENFAGIDTIRYEVCDDGTPSLCDTAAIYITVNPINDAPIAVDDAYGTEEDTPVSNNVSGNDTDPDNDNLLVTTTPVESPNNGTVTLNPDGTFTYLPAPAFNGQDTFRYEICDDITPALCDTAEVVIIIGPLNDPPYAINDINVTPKNIPTSGDVLFNDFDPENDVLDLNTMPLTNVSNGTLVLNEDGTYTYTPDQDFAGEDVFIYEVCDTGLPSLCDTAEVVITVIGDNPIANDPPIAINDNFVTLLNVAIPDINLLTNDFDPDGDDITVNVTPIVAPANGTVIIQTNGLATYQPDSAFLGDDVFTYQICDDGNPSLCDTAKVTVSVFPDAIIDNTTFASDDAGITFEDTPLTGILDDNDSDPEGDNQFLQTNPATFPTNGLITINQNGSFEYIPNPGYTGPDLFRYIVCDDGVPIACDTATVYLTVLPKNDPPYAINDVNVIPVDGIAMGNLIANDFDIEGDNIFVNINPVDQPDNGTVTINPDGTYTYTPNPGYEGEDVFQYEICDDGSPVLCDTATVTIEIINNDPLNNDPPVGVNDVFVTLVNTNVTSNIIINDFDPDGDIITITTNPVTSPQNGTVTINPDGTFEYIPDFNFTGDDDFTYRICDDQNPSLCTVATVTVTVIPPIDGLNFTFANDDVAVTQEDTPVAGNLLANDNDPEGHTQSINPTPLANPENGMVVINLDGTYTYTPDPNFVGTDQFTYLVCDNGTPSVCDSAVVNINVMPVNDPPVAIDDNNVTPVNEPTSGNLTSNDFDIEGDEITINVTPIMAPENGTVSINPNGNYTYTPNMDFQGTETFTYEICDDGLPSLCDTGLVTIHVIGNNPLVNDPPVGVNENFITYQNTSVSSNLVSNDFDPDGDNLVLTTTPLVDVMNGTVSINPNGEFTYTPNMDFLGEDQFDYVVCDDVVPALCDTVTVKIVTIPKPVDANLTYANDDVAATEENTPVSGDLTANDTDPEGDVQTINTTPKETPSNGMLVINPDGTYTYTPDAGYIGSDKFVYEICDNGSPQACDEATVYLAVTPVNDAPFAIDDIVVGPANEPTMGTLLANDFDIEGDEITVNTTPVTTPTNGTLVINADGTYTYTPNPDFAGEDMFQYEICDNGIPQKCDTANVTIYIIKDTPNQNDAPVAINDNFVTNTNQAVIDVNLLTNDFDPDGDNIIINATPISNPSNGTVSINPNGKATYTPATDYHGTDEFTYQICDDNSPKLCDTATVKLTILPTNYFENTTYANDDAGLTYENTPLTGILNDNDNDPEGDNQILQTTPGIEPSNGTITISANGEFEYIPNPGYVGADLFTYILCDDGTPVACDTATVYLTVLPLNNAPYAINDVNVIPENGIAKGNLLANDFDLEGDGFIIKTTPVQAPNNATLVINADGTYCLTPDSNFVGEVIFQYEICDDGIPSLCDTATVTVEIVKDEPNVNDPPVGVNDVFITLINNPVNSNLIVNDFDPDGDDIFITTIPVNSPEDGTVTINSDGTFAYVPNFNFTGDDEFIYRVCDNQNPSLCTEVTTTITVIPPKDGINFTYGNDDVANTTEDTPVNGNLLANDTDPEGHTQSINPTPINQPDFGMVVINLDGTYTYTPDSDYAGTDQFTYLVCDNGTPAVCDSAVVVIYISPVNDGPVAIDDILATAVNQPAKGDLLGNDFDIEGDDLIVNTTPVATPQNGTLVINPDGTYTYTPNPDFAGEDTFQYEVCDTGMPQKCDTATVTIYIIEDNPNVNDAPIAINDNFVTNTNRPVVDVNLLTNDFDPDGDNILINDTPISNPVNGTVVINNNGTATYTPAQDYVGEDEFEYQICDNQNPFLCDTATVKITILAPTIFENSTYANDDAGLTYEDTPLLGILNDNDNDPEGDNQIVQTTPGIAPMNGSLTINSDGSFEYLPNPGYSGADLFTYILCDDGTPVACDTATVYLTILPLQDAPIAKDDINLTLINTPVSGQVLTNDIDPDGDNLIVNTTPLVAPQNGTVVLNSEGTYDYTPAEDFTGEDSFDYIVCHDQMPALCDTATVTIKVIDNASAVNNPPIGIDDVNFGQINTPLSGNLLANDSDPDGDPIVITTTPVSNPSNGTVIINANGTYTYTPNPDFVGVDVFEYEVCDLGNPPACDTVQVTLEIFPNQGNTVLANDDSATGEEDSAIFGALLTNDTDPQGDNLVINTNPVSLPKHGTVTINSDGTFTYFPTENYNGPDQFVYEVCDDRIPPACAIATAYLTVLPVNDTLCNSALPKPTLLSNEPVCFTDDIYLFIQENYPLFTIENTDLNFEFLWYNSLGEVIALTDEPNLTLAANDSRATSSFTVKVRLGECSSDFADPAVVTIIELSTIVANNSSGDKGICINESIQLSATTIENTNYEWRILGQPNILSTEQNPTIANVATTTIYEVKVMPELCDTFALATVTVKVNDAPTVNPQQAVAGNICRGSTFQLLSNAVGTAPFTYAWTGPNNFTSAAANPTIGNAQLVNVGTYLLKITDANGCSAQGEVVVDSIVEGIAQPVLNSESPVCVDDNISINLQTPYAGSNITYNWINGLGNTVSTSRNLVLSANAPEAISPFVLQVTVDGCQSPNSDLINMEVQGAPTALATSTVNSVCQGGEIVLNAQAVSGATYEWRILGSPAIISTAQNPVLKNIRTSTDYTLTVRGDICPSRFTVDTISIAVIQPVDFAPNRNYTLNQNCSVANLELVANVVGSTNGLSFRWTGPNDYVATEENPTIVGVTDAFNGTYSLEITDRNGCSSSQSIFVNDLQGGIAKPTISVDKISCASDNIRLSVPLYEGAGVIYNWFQDGGTLIGLNNTNELFIDDARPGARYSVTIKIGGCLIESDTLQPVIFGQPTVTISDTPALNCTDGSEEITLNATIVGGQAPYEIVWSGSNGFKSFKEDVVLINVNESLAGTYSIEVIDQNGCTAKASTEVDVKEAPQQPVINLSGNICEGEVITLTASKYEGVEVTYNWQTPTNENIRGLNTNELIISPVEAAAHQGTYVLTVNVDGCTSISAPVTIDLIDLPTITPTATYNSTPDCASNNLILQANLSENNTGLTFAWTGPNGFTSNVENPVIVDATEENNGQYALKITNSSGCSRFVPTNIIENISTGIAQPTVQVTGTFCEGETITLSAPIYEGAAVNYNWNVPDSQNVRGFNTHELVIDVANANHSGDYSLSVSVDNCTSTATSVTINLVDLPTIQPTATYNRTVDCASSNLNLQANLSDTSSTLVYEWTGPNGFTSNVENPVIVNATEENNGQYALKITNSSGCSRSVSTNLIDNISTGIAQPTIQVTGTFCEGETITLTAPIYEGAAVNYNWNVPDSQNVRGFNTHELVIDLANANHSGDYSLSVSVDNCTATAAPVTINLVDLPTIQPTATYNRTVDCASSNLNLQANLSDTNSTLVYEWTGPNGFTSNVENPIIVNATEENNGQYILEITNSLGCSRLATTNLIENIITGLPQPIIQTSEAVCEGGLMVLTAPTYTGNQVSYQWFLNGSRMLEENTNQITIGPLANNGDSYAVQVTVDGCVLNSAAVTPTVLGMTDINPSFDLSQFCAGGTLQLSANPSNPLGNITYNWTGPNGYVSNAENPFIGKTDERYNGTYNVTISTLSGCTTNKSITVSGIINEPNQPTVITNSPVCANGDIELSIQQTSNSENYNYIWLNGAGDTIGRVRNLTIPATDVLAVPPYRAQILTDGCGSISSIPVMVDIIRLPAVLVTNNGPLCKGQEVQLSATEVPDAQYLWTDAQTGTIISTQQNPTVLTIDTTTTFNLTISIESCRVSSTVSTTVSVKEQPTITQLAPFRTLCEGQELMLNAVNGNPTDEVLAYTWKGPNNFSFTGASSDNMFPVSIPNFQANQAGTYELTIGGEGSCTSESRSVIIGVNDELITPTLTAADDVVCGGAAISLTASTQNGTGVTYEWYQRNGAGDLFLIRETTTPTMIISNATATNSGEYVVQVSKNGCPSGFSNTVQISVLDISSNIVVTNNTSLENPICEGEAVQLNAPFFQGATYTWIGPAGFTSDQPNPVIAPANSLAAGDYIVVINLEGCSNITSTPTTVFVNTQPTTPSINNSGIACVGETVTISVANNIITAGENDTLLYEWYSGTTNTLLRTTTTPNLILSNIAANQGGDYYLRLVLNGCVSEPSNRTTVEVISGANLNAFAGIDQFLCAASEVQLNATPIEDGTGIWTSPTGGIISNPNDANSVATNLQVGINQFVWTVTSGQCATSASDTMEVVVEMSTPDVAFAGLDQEICETTSINLAATALTQATGLWTQSNNQAGQGVVIIDPTNPTTSIQGLDPGNSYSFVWTISQGECTDFATDTIQLIINDLPPDNALVRDEDFVLCGEDQLMLNAEIPSFSEGRWLSETGVNIANPTSPTTFAENLKPGANVFVWALSNGACTNYSTDTLIVNSQRMPQANSENFAIELNDSLVINVLENDVLIENVNYDLIVSKFPDNGTLTENGEGSFTYKPRDNFFGMDNFRYKICSELCEELCDTAIVLLDVAGTRVDSAFGDCLIPNVISPNGDGNNDFFRISCIDQFPNNQLRIFNRWGDEVFSARNYQNNWAGTFEDLPLPSGTYFYILQLTDEPLQGFITIFR